MKGKPLYDAVIFDLDGTLWDTCPVCANSWNRAARSLNVSDPALSADDVRRYCGAPAAKMIEQLFPRGFATLGEKLVEACDREEHGAPGRDLSVLYRGVHEGLQSLALRYLLFIVSNCPLWYIELFLSLGDLGTLFKGWECHGRTGKTKGENLRNLVTDSQLRAPLYVGDTESDRKAAEEAGCAFVHAAYGFGSVSKHAVAVKSFAELLRML